MTIKWFSKKNQKKFIKAFFLSLLMAMTSVAIHEATHAIECQQAGGSITKVGLSSNAFFVRCSIPIPVFAAEFHAYSMQAIALIVLMLAFFLLKRGLNTL